MNKPSEPKYTFSNYIHLIIFLLVKSTKSWTSIYVLHAMKNTPSHTTLEGMSANSWAHGSPTQPYNEELHMDSKGDKGSTKSVKKYI